MGIMDRCANWAVSGFPLPPGSPAAQVQGRSRMHIYTHREREEEREREGEADSHPCRSSEEFGCANVAFVTYHASFAAWPVNTQNYLPRVGRATIQLLRNPGRVPGLFSSAEHLAPVVEDRIVGYCVLLSIIPQAQSVA